MKYPSSVVRPVAGVTNSHPLPVDTNRQRIALNSLSCLIDRLAPRGAVRSILLGVGVSGALALIGLLAKRLLG